MPRTGTYTLKQLSQLKALADPLRQRLMGEFAREAQTTKHVAVRLGEKPTRLYHHVQLLERVGLLKLTRTRKNRGTTEKYFRAVARKFRLDPGMVEGGRGAVETALVGLAGDTRDQLARSLRGRPARSGKSADIRMLVRTGLRLTRRNAALLRKRIEALLAEARPDREDPGAETYALDIFFFPLAPRGK